MGDWQYYATVVGSDWRSFADWAMDQSLHYPYRYCEGPSNELRYIGWVQIKNGLGQVVAEIYPRVPVGKTTNNIITAFPQTYASGC